MFHERPPLSEIYDDLILAQSMPSGAVHTNNPGGVPKHNPRINSLDEYEDFE
jgi:hypothetical protein